MSDKQQLPPTSYSVPGQRIRWAAASLQQAGVPYRIQRTGDGYAIHVSDEDVFDAYHPMMNVLEHQAKAKPRTRRDFGATVRLGWLVLTVGGWLAMAAATVYMGATWVPVVMVVLAVWAVWYTRRNEGLYRNADGQQPGWWHKRKESWFWLIVSPIVLAATAWWMWGIALGMGR